MELAPVHEIDIPAIEAMCKRAFDSMGYAETRGYVYDPDHIYRLIHNGMTEHDKRMLKVTRKGEVVGFMAVVITDFSFYSVGKKYAYEIVWHADPLLPQPTQLIIMRKMLEAMVEHLTNDGVSLFQLQLDAQHMELQRILTGFKPSTVAMIKEL